MPLRSSLTSGKARFVELPDVGTGQHLAEFPDDRVYVTSLKPIPMALDDAAGIFAVFGAVRDHFMDHKIFRRTDTNLVSRNGNRDRTFNGGAFIR